MFSRYQRIAIAALCAGVIVVAAGCEKKAAAPAGTPGAAGTPAAAPAGPALPKTLAEFRTEVEKGRQNLESVITSLEHVFASAEADLKTSFAKFQGDLRSLESQVKTVRSRSDAMKSQGASYFKTWEEQLASVATPEIRTAAEKRRDELAKNYEATTAAMTAARADYDLVYSNLTDFEKVLGNELTAGGVKALEPKAEPIKGKVKKLTKDVGSILESLERISSVYSRPK